ncbi:unnamed protein product [Pleuronectes platessa]|uniref:Uncharacterized protein n=1 Tax=Pleuronectes platessa TaxID=8262 RepID=A0A9N7U075_PLEPL|nr:unnamed protein product [Pleuronectes platessa]
MRTPENKWRALRVISRGLAMPPQHHKTQKFHKTNNSHLFLVSASSHLCAAPHPDFLRGFLHPIRLTHCNVVETHSKLKPGRAGRAEPIIREQRFLNHTHSS